jgi:hypothetical protein
MCSSLVLEWRSTVRAVLRDWRAGVLRVSPARVFVFRGAAMASKGLREAFEGSSMGEWERVASPDAA